MCFHSLLLLGCLFHNLKNNLILFNASWLLVLNAQSICGGSRQLVPIDTSMFSDRWLSWLIIDQGMICKGSCDPIKSSHQMFSETGSFRSFRVTCVKWSHWSSWSILFLPNVHMEFAWIFNYYIFENYRYSCVFRA